MKAKEGVHNSLRPVLVSACLLGERCRYDGRDNADGPLQEFLERRGEEAHGFCPEEQGGLPTPRPAASLTAAADAVLEGSGQVLTEGGEDVSAAFRSGADAALEFCRSRGIGRAYLKERSPSCGVRQTHVRAKLVDGPGLTAARLARAGIETIGAEGRRGSRLDP